MTKATLPAHSPLRHRPYGASPSAGCRTLCSLATSWRAPLPAAGALPAAKPTAARAGLRLAPGR